MDELLTAVKDVYDEINERSENDYNDYIINKSQMNKFIIETPDGKLVNAEEAIEWLNKEDNDGETN